MKHNIYTINSPQNVYTYFMFSCVEMDINNWGYWQGRTHALPDRAMFCTTNYNRYVWYVNTLKAGENKRHFCPQCSEPVLTEEQLKTISTLNLMGGYRAINEYMFLLGAR